MFILGCNFMSTCLPDDMKHKGTRRSSQRTKNRFVLQFKYFQDPKSAPKPTTNVNIKFQRVFTFVFNAVITCLLTEYAEAA